MSSVFFINPPGPEKLYRSIVCTFLSKANYIWQPQDFINLSAKVPSGAHLNFLDCCQKKLSAPEALATVGAAHPDLALVALSSITFEQDLAFVKALRAQMPQGKILVLGNVVLERAFWPLVLDHADGIVLNSFTADIAKFLEGAEECEGIVNRGSGEAYVVPKSPTKARPIALGLPRHELFLDKAYRFPFVKSFLYATVSTQFGCSFQCSYCSWSQIPVYFREPEEVLRELEAVQNLGVRDLFFGDASFGQPRANAKAILEGMIARNIKLRWVCYTNPSGIDTELLGLMRRAGCHTVIIGIDDENMELIRDEFNRTLARPKLLSFCEEANRLGMEICGDFIIGLNPAEGAVERLVKFACSLRLDYASFNILNPLFGSSLREKWVSEGKLAALDLDTDTSGKAGTHDPQLIALRDYAVKRFYLRPAYLWRRLSRCRSWAEFTIRFREMLSLLKNTRLFSRAAP